MDLNPSFARDNAKGRFRRRSVGRNTSLRWGGSGPCRQQHSRYQPQDAAGHESNAQMETLTVLPMASPSEAGTDASSCHLVLFALGRQHMDSYQKHVRPNRELERQSHVGSGQCETCTRGGHRLVVAPTSPRRPQSYRKVYDSARQHAQAQGTPLGWALGAYGARSDSSQGLEMSWHAVVALAAVAAQLQMDRRSSTALQGMAVGITGRQCLWRRLCGRPSRQHGVARSSPTEARLEDYGVELFAALMFRSLCL